MSRFFVRLALNAGICVSFVYSTAAAEPATSARPLPNAGQDRILVALNQRTDFDFREQPFREAMNYFQQKHEIEILLDSKALGDAGVDAETPLTRTLKKITLRSALRLLLRPLDLTYVVGDGYLLITSKTEAENKLSFRVYPVQDLVTIDSVFRPAPPASGAAESFPGLNPAFPGLAKPVEASDFQGLIDVITSTVGPTTWDEVGGPGSITDNAHSQAIGVSQTDEIHEEIVVLLAALRRVRDEQIAAAKPAGSASAEAPEQQPLKLRAYRLMRGPKPPGKSGWRPPVGVVGDSTPPRNAQARTAKQDEPEPPGGQAGAGNEAPPVKDAAPAKEAAANPTDNKLEAWAAMIAKVVPEMIEPQSWEPAGEGMIRAVGEGVVVRHTEEVHHRVARLMAELLPDYVPVDGFGPWGPWMVALKQADQAAMPRLKLATTENWPQQAEPRPCGEEAHIQETLLEKCDVDFNQVPLIEALNRLAATRQVQLYVDHQALTDSGLGVDTPVTRLIKGLSCRTALKLLLDELDLTYLIRDEVLLITSKTEEENTLTIQVYPVFDLVVRPPHAPANRPGLDFESLINNIVANIAPTTWDEVGGPGSIKPFTNSGALVISQTRGAHEEISEYLRAMRDAGAAQKQHADATQ